MNNLIKVNYESDNPTISARELHGLLEVKTPYDKWFPRMCEYGFTDATDFSTFLSESTGGRPAQDAQMTIEMAKEICMIQRTEKGKQARQYFIQLEKDWNSPEKIMARALKLADKQIQSLTGQIKEMKPKVLFADSVSVSTTSILVGDFAKILKQNGVEMGANRLFSWFRDNGYLIKRKGTDHNMPTQKSMELKLFKIKETTIDHSDGHVTISKTPKLTGNGQLYFINKFLG